MANVVRYDPFDLLEGMMKSVLRPSFEAYQAQQAAAFPVDVTEDDRGYYIWAELPGVKKEDVSIAISGGQVSISAEAKREAAIDQGQGQENMLLNERRYGNFARTLQFAAEIDDAKAEATYRDGVLILRLPKAPSAQVKRLTIH